MKLFFSDVAAVEMGIMWQSNTQKKNTEKTIIRNIRT